MTNDYFAFEADFVEANIRCIPMIVRFKLDACGIKLKLAQWSRMTEDERGQLANAPCGSREEMIVYKDYLCDLIVKRTGDEPTSIPIPENPAWSRTDEVPHTVQEKMAEMSLLFSLEHWNRLSALQRFALLKLSSPGHENKNFPRAIREFGLLPA